MARTASFRQKPNTIYMLADIPDKSVPPAIGPEILKKMEKEKQVEALLDLAFKKGLKHAIRVAEALDDPYVLDRFHDELKKSQSADR